MTPEKKYRLKIAATNYKGEVYAPAGTIVTIRSTSKYTIEGLPRQIVAAEDEKGNAFPVDIDNLEEVKS